MIRRPPRSTHCISSAASDVYKRQTPKPLIDKTMEVGCSSSCLYKIRMALSFTEWIWTFLATASCARTFALIFAVNWLIGIIFIQYFYHITAKLRNLSPKAKAKYAPYINQVQLWNRFVHSFFSFLLVPRFTLLAIAIILMWALLKLLSVGSTVPLLGWRRKGMIIVGYIASRTILFCMSFVYIKYKDLDVDYSPWLGKDWKTPADKPPIMISNHRGCMVLLILL
eukprot:TRINITY_DN6553_c0_g1_i6.p1 TRINITY_DN6553_c0_g1~~TRINITY_DN6553_c0_g1_i6.p1  ORF type:complete len:232 (-),score=34.83 TRINITY_DN6553_c0_g1_i6:430-1104(-)